MYTNFALKYQFPNDTSCTDIDIFFCLYAGEMGRDVLSDMG